MPGSQQSTAPPLDLDRYSEAVRRRLYDLIQAAEFTSRVDADDPEKDYEPLYSAEDARLSVFYLAGRWFARWNRLEVPNHEPQAKQVELLRVKLSDENPLGYMLHEC